MEAREWYRKAIGIGGSWVAEDPQTAETRQDLGTPACGRTLFVMPPGLQDLG